VLRRLHRFSHRDESPRLLEQRAEGHVILQDQHVLPTSLIIVINVLLIVILLLLAKVVKRLGRREDVRHAAGRDASYSARVHARAADTATLAPVPEPHREARGTVAEVKLIALVRQESEAVPVDALYDVQRVAAIPVIVITTTQRRNFALQGLKTRGVPRPADREGMLDVQRVIF
jgi:hypothetical protein